MRDNQILLSKLVEIVGRKKSNLLPEMIDNKSRTQSSWSQSLINSPSAHKTIINGTMVGFSLNGTWRKKEYERIERENQALATRLFL